MKIKSGNSFPKRGTISIIVIVVFLSIAGGYIYYSKAFLPAQTTNGSDVQTAVAQRGNLVLSASGSVTLVSQTDATFGFDTAAQEEITALTEQIQETMTADQMKAINAMNLTPQDMFTMMQEQGIQFRGGRQQNGQGGSGQSNDGNFQSPDGGGEFFVRPGNGEGGPGAGGGPGGFGGGQGQSLSPEQIATMEARRAENGGNSFRFNSTPASLIQALVKLLQEKAGS